MTRKKQNTRNEKSKAVSSSGSGIQKKIYRNVKKGNKTESLSQPKPVNRSKPVRKAAVKTAQHTKTKKPKGKFRIIPLGGLGEIGKNMTVIEYDGKMIVIDCGMSFPDGDMPGIDYVVPDTTYLEQNADKILGIFLTHGHEDHIGAIPVVLKKIKVPVYGTRLTLGIVMNRLKEHKMDKSVELIEKNAGDVVKTGPFSVEFIAVNHSIADAVAFAVKTELGTILHTGDFKMDMTPIAGDPIDLVRLGTLGNEGVLALLSESTNACEPGVSSSERHIGETFRNIFSHNKKKRIIVATFSSNVHRVQQVIDAAAAAGRKVAISGRSMENVISVAMELGYMKIPSETLIGIDEISAYPNEKLVIVTTGAQGEPMSALYRMAYSDHKKVEIGSGDLVIISANAIPGNERSVNKVINELMKSGAEVVYSSAESVHVSGHACSEELSMMLSLVRPKYFFPIHGEYRHQKAHEQLARFAGIPANRIFIMENGSVVEIDSKSAKNTGKVQAGEIYVDGLGVGDVGNIVLRERKKLGEDGLIAVVVAFYSDSTIVASGPDIISRGFVYVNESGDLLAGARDCVSDILEKCSRRKTRDWSVIKSQIRDGLSRYISDQTKRTPMIMPIIIEV